MNYKSCKTVSFVLAIFLIAIEAKGKKLSTSKLVCYYGNGEDAMSGKCTHVVLPQEADLDAAREKLDGVKILLSLDRINEVSVVKNSVRFKAGWILL